jgi:ornithine cyclodeaminase/alanine dehydrogenase-like protein (mu-crystallin family)
VAPARRGAARGVRRRRERAGALEPFGHARGDRLLLMPAWDGAGLGVKIVTVFPRNHERGLASVGALYVLLDGATGHPSR